MIARQTWHITGVTKRYNSHRIVDNTPQSLARVA